MDKAPGRTQHKKVKPRLPASYSVRTQFIRVVSLDVLLVAIQISTIASFLLRRSPAQRFKTSLRMMSSNTSIYWYRNALRFHDNPSLSDACDKSKILLPLYVIDPEAPFAQTKGLGAGCIRANFVLESMKEVHKKLQQMDSQLVVILGKPETVLPKVASTIDASDLYYEQEAAAPVRESDREVLSALNNGGSDSQKCEIHGFATHTLHPMEKYLAKCKDGTAPSTYGAFTKVFQKMTIPKEVDDVESVPPLPENAIDKLKKAFGDDMHMPKLEELGYNKDELKNRKKGGIDFDGGEDFALTLLDNMMSRTEWVANFEKPKTSPNALTVDTTGLSPCKLSRVSFCRIRF